MCAGRLQGDGNLDGVSHVVVDEIHERSIDSDFLLIILRDLVLKRPDIKLVLMSATLNAALFSSYFGDCPCIEIPGFTHPVTEHYLEDCLELTGYVVDPTGVSCAGTQQSYQSGCALKSLSLCYFVVLGAGLC